MKYRAAGQFAARACVVAAVVAVPLLAAGWPRGGVFLGWSLGAWSMMAVIGVAGGTWLVLEHGKPTAGFLVAVGACMLTRLIVASAGAFAAAYSGGRALGAYLVGLGVGYVPLQVFETLWLMRQSRRSRVDPAP